MNLQITYRIAKTMLWLVPFVLLFCFASKYYAFSGVFVAEKNLPERSPFISRLFPPGRLEEGLPSGASAKQGQTMFLEPVYFDVLVTRPFRKATIELTYKNKDHSIVMIGGRSGNEWNYELKVVEKNSALTSTVLVKARAVSFDFASLKIDKSKVRFMISAPGLEGSGRKIVLQKIRVIFEGRSL